MGRGRCERSRSGGGGDRVGPALAAVGGGLGVGCGWRIMVDRRGNGRGVTFGGHGLAAGLAAQGLRGLAVGLGVDLGHELVVEVHGRVVVHTETQLGRDLAVFDGDLVRELQTLREPLQRLVRDRRHVHFFLERGHEILEQPVDGSERVIAVLAFEKSVDVCVEFRDGVHALGVDFAQKRHVA